MAELREIPPVTRFLCASSLAVTMSVALNVVSRVKVILLKQPVLYRLEVRSGLQNMSPCTDTGVVVEAMRNCPVICICKGASRDLVLNLPVATDLESVCNFFHKQVYFFQWKWVLLMSTSSDIVRPADALRK
jgi:hypothetical protein